LIYYIGAYLDVTTQRTLIERVLKVARVTAIHSPSGVEIRSLHTPDGNEIFMVINHLAEDQNLIMPWSSYDHLSNQEVSSEIRLRPYGVAILSPTVAGGSIE